MSTIKSLRLSSLFLLSLLFAIAVAMLLPSNIVRILVIGGILAFSIGLRMLAYGNVSLRDLAELRKTPRTSLQKALAFAQPFELVIEVLLVVWVLNR